MASKKTQLIKIIILIAVLAFSSFMIYANYKGVLIFAAGFIVGCLCLMVLREILWNTHELLKDKD